MPERKDWQAENAVGHVWAMLRIVSVCVGRVRNGSVGRIRGERGKHCGDLAEVGDRDEELVGGAMWPAVVEVVWVL